jgi:hypothetical protein
MCYLLNCTIFFLVGSYNNVIFNENLMSRPHIFTLDQLHENCEQLKRELLWSLEGDLRFLTKTNKAFIN